MLAKRSNRVGENKKFILVRLKFIFLAQDDKILWCFLVFFNKGLCFFNSFLVSTCLVISIAYFLKRN